MEGGVDSRVSWLSLTGMVVILLSINFDDARYYTCTRNKERSVVEGNDYLDIWRYLEQQHVGTITPS